MNEHGIEHHHISLIEEMSVKNRPQLNAREGHWIRELDTYKNGLNGCVAGRSQKESQRECDKTPARIEYKKELENTIARKEYLKDYRAQPEVKARHAENQRKYMAAKKAKAAQPD